MVWKMFLLFQGCILRFHVNLPGCTPMMLRKFFDPNSSCRLRYPQHDLANSSCCSLHCPNGLQLLNMSWGDVALHLAKAEKSCKSYVILCPYDSKPKTIQQAEVVCPALTSSSLLIGSTWLLHKNNVPNGPEIYSCLVFSMIHCGCQAIFVAPTIFTQPLARAASLAAKAA